MGATYTPICSRSVLRRDTQKWIRRRMTWRRYDRRTPRATKLKNSTRKKAITVSKTSLKRWHWTRNWMSSKSAKCFRRKDPLINILWTSYRRIIALPIWGSLWSSRKAKLRIPAILYNQIGVLWWCRHRNCLCKSTNPRHRIYHQPSSSSRKIEKGRWARPNGLTIALDGGCQAFCHPLKLIKKQQSVHRWRLAWEASKGHKFYRLRGPIYLAIRRTRRSIQDSSTQGQRIILLRTKYLSRDPNIWTTAALNR